MLNELKKYYLFKIYLLRTENFCLNIYETEPFLESFPSAIIMTKQRLNTFLQIIQTVHLVMLKEPNAH